MSETLVDDDRLDGTMDPSRVLADPQGEADRNAEPLAAAEVLDGMDAGTPVSPDDRFHLERLIGPLALKEPQLQFAAGDLTEVRVGTIDNPAFRLAKQLTLKPFAAEKLGECFRNGLGLLGLENLGGHVLPVVPVMQEQVVIPLAFAASFGRLASPNLGLVSTRRHLERVAPRAGFPRAGSRGGRCRDATVPAAVAPAAARRLDARHFGP